MKSWGAAMREHIGGHMIGRWHGGDPSEPYRTPEAREQARQLLEAHNWIFAKTMPKIPHHYTLRRKWETDDDFMFCVRVLEANSYERPFYKKMYRYCDLGEHTYWHCDESAEKCTLINRKPLGT